jgi:DNA-directed RNA polymerase specialized sigma24 family protein
MHSNSGSLVERARAGDRRALEDLVVLHLPALRAFVRVQAGRELRDKESCSDLVQSACREVLADLSGFEYREEAGFRRWLFRAAERKILDRARFHGREKRDAKRQEALPAGESGVLDCYASFCTPSQVAASARGAGAPRGGDGEAAGTYREVLRLRHSLGLSERGRSARRSVARRNTRACSSASAARLGGGPRGTP